MQFVMVQVVGAQTPAPVDPSDPLISRENDLAIYIGLGLLVLALGFLLKSLSVRFERVILFSFTLTVILIVVLWYL